MNQTEPVLLKQHAPGRPAKSKKRYREDEPQAEERKKGEKKKEKERNKSKPWMNHDIMVAKGKQRTI